MSSPQGPSVQCVLQGPISMWVTQSPGSNWEADCHRLRDGLLSQKEFGDLYLPQGYERSGSFEHPERLSELQCGCQSLGEGHLYLYGSPSTQNGKRDLLQCRPTQSPSK